MPRPGLLISRCSRVLPLGALLLLFSMTAGAFEPNFSRYPLRVHVLAADKTYKSPRMNPAQSVVCDTIDDMVSSISPNPGGPITITGVSGDPCSFSGEVLTGRLMDLGDNAPLFSGDGRADLVSPPSTTQGVTFHYDDCARLRVRPGFQSLPARWKIPGHKLEVLVPSDDIPANGRPLPPLRCTLTVNVQDFVYLLLPNKTVIQVSQEDYWKRPALRVFLQGPTQTVEQRLKDDFTISAHPTSLTK